MATGDKRIKKRSQYANHHEPAVSHDNQYAKKNHWMPGMKDRKRNKKRRKRKYAQQRKSHQLTENGLYALKDDGLYYNEGIRDDRNKTKKEIGCCEQNWNKFDGRKIDKNNRNVLEGYLTPEKQDTWNIFCCRMESITSFPRSSFKNMESITDIMNLLKRKRDDNKILAYSCLMDSVRGMELSYPKHIDIIFNKIMDLDQQSKTHVKHAKRITVQGESTEVKMGDVGTYTINDNQKAINDCDEEQMTNRLAEHGSPAKYGRKSPYVYKKVFPPGQYERNCLDNVKQKASMDHCKCTWSLEPRHSDRDIRNRTVSMVTDMMSRISSYKVWPNRSIRTGTLVDGGFCCKDPHTTTVECTACGLVLDASTLNGKSPLDYHREQSSDCEFFHQTNSQNSDRQQTKPLTNSPNILAAMGNNQGANAFPASSPPRNNHRSTDTSGRAQTENNQEAKGKPVRTPPGYSDGNIRIDKAPGDRRQTENASSLFANNGAASSEPLVAKRPRTGEVFDRTALSVPNNNNNNVTSSGKGLRENGNTATVADTLNVLKAPFFLLVSSGGEVSVNFPENDQSEFNETLHENV